MRNNFSVLPYREFSHRFTSSPTPTGQTLGRLAVRLEELRKTRDAVRSGQHWSSPSAKNIIAATEDIVEDP